jgi:geranylgeranyl pyrophosphate synthase
MLDFTTTSSLFGKPVNADLSLGLATAPVLYASQKHPELEPLISRNFDSKGDVRLANELVLDSNGIEETRRLAEVFCKEAVNSLDVLDESEAKQGLVDWAEKVLSRTK